MWLWKSLVNNERKIPTRSQLLKTLETWPIQSKQNHKPQKRQCSQAQLCPPPLNLPWSFYYTEIIINFYYTEITLFPHIIFFVFQFFSSIHLFLLFLFILAAFYFMFYIFKNVLLPFYSYLILFIIYFVSSLASLFPFFLFILSFFSFYIFPL